MPSCLPHQATAEPAWLPSDPQGDASRDTMGTEGVLVGVRLVWAAGVLAGAHATSQHDGNDPGQRGETHGPQRPRDFFGVRRYRLPARQGIQ